MRRGEYSWEQKSPGIEKQTFCNIPGHMGLKMLHEERELVTFSDTNYSLS